MQRNSPTIEELFPSDGGMIFKDVINLVSRKGHVGLQIRSCGKFMENVLRALWAPYTFVYPELREASPLDLMKMEKTIASDDLVYFVCGEIPKNVEQVLLKKLSIVYVGNFYPPHCISLNPREPVGYQAFSEDDYYWIAYDLSRSATLLHKKPFPSDYDIGDYLSNSFDIDSDTD